MVAVLLEIDDYGRVQAAFIAVGACSEMAQRLSGLEFAIVGASIGGGRLSQLVGDKHLSPLRPVSDVRGTATYRLDAASTLIRRALDDVQDRLR